MLVLLQWYIYRQEWRRWIYKSVRFYSVPLKGYGELQGKRWRSNKSCGSSPTTRTTTRPTVRGTKLR